MTWTRKTEPVAGVTLLEGDALGVLAALEPGSVDLVFGSPPYEDCRTYGIEFGLAGQAWVDWMVQVVQASLRVSRGLVAFVVEGKTRQFRWSATPALLMADLHRAGVCLRKPPAYKRVGIPGSGGREWLRNDYEFVVCATNGGRLPWADPTATGGPPKYQHGGGATNRRKDGSRQRAQAYANPERTNPGNVVDCGAVGGGNMGNRLCHENEAPFSEQLAEFFVRSFCPPGGVVLDPFSGSGTTVAVARMLGRRGIGVDVRASQIGLAVRRLLADEERIQSEQALVWSRARSHGCTEHLI